MRALVVAVLLVFAVHAFAWNLETYQYLAGQTLLSYYPHCKQQIDEGAVYPDSIEPFNARLGESFNQHCDMAPGLGTCPAYDAAYCETKVKTCNATGVAGLWMERAKNQCCCDQAYSLAVALNYHASALAVMHQIINEDPQCHQGFEKAVNDAIKSNQSGWSVSFTCTRPPRTFTFTSANLDDLELQASTSMIHEDFKDYYCDTCNYEPPVKKQNGGTCAGDGECNSGYCDVRQTPGVCCAGGTCCAAPGSDAAPCVSGQVCSPDYACVAKNYKDGQVCKTNLDCTSRYCAPGSVGGSVKYCCSGSSGQSCCASDSECLAGETCQNSLCQVGVIPGNGTVQNGTQNGTGGNQTNGGGGGGKICPFFFIPLALLGLLLLREK